MIKTGDQICFKAKYLHYDTVTDECHFLIQKIKKPVVVKRKGKTFKEGKPAIFKATCLYTYEMNFIFNLECCEPGKLVFELSQTNQEYNKTVLRFLRKAKILFFLYRLVARG